MGCLRDDEENGALKEKEPNEAIVYVNGERKVFSNGLAHLTLLEYLRGNCFFFVLFLWLIVFNVKRGFGYVQRSSIICQN